MKDALISAGLQIPSNSSTKYLERLGIPFDERLGGNCVFQLNALLELLGPSAIDKSRFISSYVGNVLHYAMLLDEGRDTYYLDPFLMHTEPVKVKDIMRTGVMVEAFPIGNKVSFQHTGGDTFQATLYRPHSEVQFEQVRNYQFDLNEATAHLPDYDEFTTYDPKKFSVRAIHPSAQELFILHYHLQTAGYNIVRYNSNGQSESIKQRSQSTVFENTLQRMANIMLVEKGDLYDSLLQAHYYATDGYGE